MFSIDDTVVYKGHGLVKIMGIPKKRYGYTVDVYYMLRSPRTTLSQTKLMVKVQGAEKVLRFLVSEQEANEILDILGGDSTELPDDSRERMQIIDEVVEKNDINELAALIRDYRESRVGNLERPEIKKIKAISRNIAEELCHVLKVNRASLRGKLFVRSAG